MQPTDERRSSLYSATSPLRWVMFAAGWLCVGLGIFGIIMPGFPGTVFLILAAWLFARSSPRFEAWLLGHPRLGPSVRAWREKGAVPRWVPFVASGSMMASFGILLLLGMSLPVLGMIGATFIAVSAYLFTRPTA